MIWEAKDCDVGSAGRARHSEFSIEASLSSSSLLMQTTSGAHKSQSLSRSNPRNLANSLFSAAWRLQGYLGNLKLQRSYQKKVGVQKELHLSMVTLAFEAISRRQIDSRPWATAWCIKFQPLLSLASTFALLCSSSSWQTSTWFPTTARWNPSHLHWPWIAVPVQCRVQNVGSGCNAGGRSSLHTRMKAAARLMQPLRCGATDLKTL
jgi:hypothetical protein